MGKELYENKKSIWSDNYTFEPMSFLSVLELNGYRIISTTYLEKFSEKELIVSQEVMQRFLSFTDLLLFIDKASRSNVRNVCYHMYPPYTTSKPDAMALLRRFYDLGIVRDIFYSDLSSSFWIEMNQKSRLLVRDIIRIGLLNSLSITNDEVVLGLTVEKGKRRNTFDFAYMENDKIFLYSVFLALFHDMSKTYKNKTINRLISRVKNKSLIISTTEVFEYYIVTNQTKKMMSPLNNVISIDKILLNE